MTQLPRTRYLLIAIATVLALTSASAQSAPDAAGYWKGSYQTPGGDIAFSIQLGNGRDGGWIGEIDIPSMGIRDLELNTISVTGPEVLFGVMGIQGDPTFSGTLSDDGQTISGSLSQAGHSFIFKLQRSSEPPEDDSHIYDDYEKKGKPGVGLPGVWLGLVEASPSRLRLILEVSTATDGALGATLTSPDQESGAIPVDTVTFRENTVHLGIASLNATYQGEMNPDGSALSGRWEQTGMSFPLKFNRQDSSR